LLTGNGPNRDAKKFDFNPLTPTVGTAVKHHALDRVKPSVVIFDIRAL